MKTDKFGKYYTIHQGKIRVYPQKYRKERHWAGDAFTCIHAMDSATPFTGICMGCVIALSDETPHRKPSEPDKEEEEEEVV